MDTNPRMSIMRPTPNSKSRSKREEEDTFLVLSERDIADCINDLGLDITIVDIQKPQAQVVQRIFEYFVEVAMQVTRDVVAPAMKAAADDVGGQYSEIYPVDTLDLLGLFINLRKLLDACGVHDFQLQDLFKPTRERVVKQFSYVINFLRFRESQQSVTNEYYSKAERTKQRIDTLWAENQAKQDQLTELERNKKATDLLIRDKEARAEDLKKRLIDLKRSQEKHTERLERGREDQARRKTALEEKSRQTLSAKQEAQKLRPYTTQSPTALEATLRDLTTALAADKSLIETLERRVRALQTSTDAFTTVTADIDACTSLLHELGRDLAAEDATLASAAKNREALSERSNNVRDVERRERQLQKQLENVQTKTEALWRKAEERKKVEAKRMEDITRVNEELKWERGRSEREMERMRGRIDQVEKKMADLRENVEGEVLGARDEFLRLDSHVQLYIREMDQSVA